jgi:DNA-binding transcriptional LysR family regulator
MDRLSAIEVFVRVVDTGSFSAVARLQNIGQPAVSKAVVQLEEWLGVSLLMRSTRSVTPTEAGRIFYERAKRMTEEASEAVVAARGKASGLSASCARRQRFVLDGSISFLTCRRSWPNTPTSISILSLTTATSIS